MLGETKRKRQQLAKDDGPNEISLHLARALEEAQDLFPSSSTSSNTKRTKNRKISHFEINRDSEGRRIYHCPRKGKICIYRV